MSLHLLHAVPVLKEESQVEGRLLILVPCTGNHHILPRRQGEPRDSLTHVDEVAARLYTLIRLKEVLLQRDRETLH